MYPILLTVLLALFALASFLYVRERKECQGLELENKMANREVGLLRDQAADLRRVTLSKELRIRELELEQARRDPGAVFDSVFGRVPENKD